MTENEFAQALKKLNLNCDEKILKQLKKYYDLIVEWNNKFNLTRILDQEECYLKHFYDALTIVRVIDLKGKLLDVGTGAGIPGIVLKIFFKDLEIDLIDSNYKKTEFLKFVIKELNLNKINVINDRVELYAKAYFEAYDIVVSRAVAPLNVLSELCLPLVKLNGYFIAMKGIASEEIEDGEYAINFLGGKIENINKFKLPILDHERTLIKIQKIKHTNNFYPREFNKINKKPLKK